MDYGLYISAAGALAQSARVDGIAHNLANANTPGFRRVLHSIQSRQVASREDPGSHYDSSDLHDRIGGGLHLAKEQEHLHPGPISRTGRNLDLAISGDGFFAVQDPKTQETFYTRAGNFTLDPVGQLRTADKKHIVLGQGGTGIIVNNPAHGNIAGQVKIQVFDPEAVRERVGSNLYRFEGEGKEILPMGKVHSGSLEHSSVRVVSEMVEMIKALRAYESNMNAIRSHDFTLGKAVNEIARAVR